MGTVTGGNFDHGQNIADRVHAGTAVGFGNFDTHQSVFTQQLDVFQREFTGPVEMFGTRGDLLLCDTTCHVPDHQLLIGEAKIHIILSRKNLRFAILPP